MELNYEIYVCVLFWIPLQLRIKNYVSLEEPTILPILCSMFHGSIHVMSWENQVKQSFLHHFTFLNGKSKLSFFSLFSMRVDKTTSESQAESVELLLVSGRFLKKFIYKLGHRFINLVFKTRFLVESNFLIYYPPNWIFDYLGVIPNSNMIEENFCWTVGILISIFPALKNFQVK